jgi:RNA polymerase sigma-70 factor (ECF subfamily)
LTKEEFKLCFDELFDPVRNYIFYKCHDEEIATDVTQETFMKIWEKKFTYHPIKTKGLIYKIANQLWISQYRKLESSKKYQLSLSSNDLKVNSEHNLELKELKEKYETTLSNLPLNNREVFLMSRMEELTYKEIAQRLNVSIKTIEKRMSKTLNELRKALNYEK